MLFYCVSFFRNPVQYTLQSAHGIMRTRQRAIDSLSQSQQRQLVVGMMASMVAGRYRGWEVGCAVRDAGDANVLK